MGTQRDGEFTNGWMVVVSAFFIGFLTDGLAFSFGVLLIELTNEFQDSIAVIAFTGSLTNSVMHLTGPLVGLLSGVISSRAIVIFGAVTSFGGFLAATFSKSLVALSMTYGLLTGIGFCLMFLPANAQVIQRFEKRRALAAGIAACGSGVGTFVNSLLFRYLIDLYTWRGAVLVLSGTILHGIPCGLLLTSQNNNNNTTVTQSKPDAPDSDTKHALRDLKNSAIEHLRLLKDLRCLSVLASTFLVNLAFSVPSILLPDQAVHIGMTKTQATWLVSSIGMASIFGRALCGWLADYKCVNKTAVFESTLVLAGLSTAMSPFLDSFETKMLYTCLYGFLIGGYVVLIPVVLADMFGPDLIEKSYGLQMLAVGIPCLFAAPLGGWLFETTGSFTITYAVAGAALVFGGLTLLLPVCYKRLKGNALYVLDLEK